MEYETNFCYNKWYYGSGCIFYYQDDDETYGIDNIGEWYYDDGWDDVPKERLATNEEILNVLSKEAIKRNLVTGVKTFTLIDGELILTSKGINNNFQMSLFKNGYWSKPKLKNILKNKEEFKNDIIMNDDIDFDEMDRMFEVEEKLDPTSTKACIKPNKHKEGFKINKKPRTMDFNSSKYNMAK